MPEITEKELPLSLKPLWLKALTAYQNSKHERSEAERADSKPTESERSNLDYAIKLLQGVLKDSPGFLDARKLLRKCELELSGGTKKKGLFGLSGGGMGVMKLHSQAKKDPVGTLPLIEKELEKDPLNDQANDLLHDIALKLELFETAAFALEIIRKYSPENNKLLHKLAEFYLVREEPLLASEVYNDIIKHHPIDGAAIKGSKDASARASMKKQKWDENADMRDLMRDSAGVEELEKASRTGLTREQLEDRRDSVIEKYNTDPNQLVTVKELAGIYEQLEDWHNAYTFYNWAHTLSVGDVALASKAAIMNDRAIDLDLKNLGVAAAADPDNLELKAALEARRADRLTEQIQEAQRRVDQNPTDPQLRFELGTALYNAGDFSAAIPHLQQSTRNPHIRTKVLLLLGRTFKAKGMFDLAIKQLSDALADLHTMDHIKKEVLYEKGILHSDMGDKATALDCFKQIYEVDYGYRDVASRVESSYS